MLLLASPTPANTTTMYQNNFTLTTDDLPAVLCHVSEQDVLSFVRFRDAVSTLYKVPGNLPRLRQNRHAEVYGKRIATPASTMCYARTMCL